MFDFAETTKDMTAEEILNYYRNLYYAEPQVTERGIVANAINDYLQKAAPRAEVAKEIFAEIRQRWARRLFECGDFSFKDFKFEDFAGDLDELFKKYTEEDKK